MISDMSKGRTYQENKEKVQDHEKWAVVGTDL